MTLLISGGAGFIGSHFLELVLSRTEWPIICLDDFNAFYDSRLKRKNLAHLSGHPRVQIIEGSFCDPATVEKLFSRETIRRVVHLGAHAGVGPSMDRPLDYIDVNVGGTLVLLEAVRAHPVERFLFASSSTVYGYDIEVPFREDGPLGIPLCPYGVSKRAAELLTLVYWQVHGVPAVCVRPFSVYGPRLRPDLALAVFATAILEGRPLRLNGDGSVRRDFTHVSDICEGLFAALTTEAAVGQIINLGRGEPVEIRQLIALLEHELGRQAIVTCGQPAAGDLPASWADLTKARRLLGYEPRIHLSDGVRDYVNWLRRERQT